ncbi:MAG: nucleoside triphosphate pyrophosphohydrolase family protein [Actinobacteria bacterium]|nr:nucleoside triphosphate pyrophosphohydrolase family protein [Actinomycetota bacterium]MCA1806277.1 nucleoside triphosphate pyrophosphohydrolase family protein [Actinomycetota bacterium]
MPDSLTFQDYQEQAIHTLLYPGSGEIQGLLYVALGLNGEAGEVAEKVKKILRDNQSVVGEEQRENLILEAGDVLWYIAGLCHELGISIEEVASRNIEKLNNRHKSGTIQGSGDHR